MRTLNKKGAELTTSSDESISSQSIEALSADAEALMDQGDPDQQTEAKQEEVR